MKIVVFDLDETLGYFVEFGIFWDCLSRYFQLDLSQDIFNNTLDLYPEFLRPNIDNILGYLISKKKSKACHKIMIYTNNQAPKKWANQLISYFESKLDQTKIFDQIICAFKINGQRVELSRTSHDKTYNDLIKCTKIPLDAEICFLDDNYFPGMKNKNVYYINVKPYVHDLKFNEVVTRFINNDMSQQLIIEKGPVRHENKQTVLNHFVSYMMKEFKAYNFMCIEKPEDEYEIDKILGKQIMIHLHTFFQTPTFKGTRRYRGRVNKMKTRKLR